MGEHNVVVQLACQCDFTCSSIVLRIDFPVNGQIKCRSVDLPPSFSLSVEGGGDELLESPPPLFMTIASPISRAFIVIPWMRIGMCRISRRCFMIRHSCWRFMPIAMRSPANTGRLSRTSPIMSIAISPIRCVEISLVEMNTDFVMVESGASFRMAGSSVRRTRIYCRL